MANDWNPVAQPSGCDSFYNVYRSVAVTRSSLSDSNNVKMYVDGVEVATATIPNVYSDSTGAAAHVAATARYRNNMDYIWLGYLSHVYVDNRAYSAAEIASLHAAHATPPPSSHPVLFHDTTDFYVDGTSASMRTFDIPAFAHVWTISARIKLMDSFWCSATHISGNHNKKVKFCIVDKT